MITFNIFFFQLYFIRSHWKRCKNFISRKREKKDDCSRARKKCVCSQVLGRKGQQQQNMKRAETSWRCIYTKEDNDTAAKDLLYAFLMSMACMLHSTGNKYYIQFIFTVRQFLFCFSSIIFALQSLCGLAFVVIVIHFYSTIIVGVFEIPWFFFLWCCT